MAEVRAPGRSTHGGVTPSSLSRGTRLGRYELLAPIGVGGMAKVWAARQSGYGGFAKVVAIKTILPHLSRESDFERLFVDEARVASLVRHPNVCEIFELSEDGQVLFLVMEWVDGDSLFKLLKVKDAVVPIDPRIAARIAAETCAGLHAAHEQPDHDGKPLNIVHRDVSPHNILLSAEGVVKVTDFGVAKAAGQTHDQTMAGQLKGKLEYMSPEQITGARVDGRTDVFGMGGVIYEATTGVQPFASSGDLEVMNKIVEGRLAPPSSHVRNYPRELEAIVLRAMANDPDQRFAHAEEMQLALEAWIGRSGPLVTHAEVAALLRSRVGPKMDERLERIRSAMAAAPPKNPSHTPSGSGISTSGVIPTNRVPRIAPLPPALPQATVAARPAPPRAAAPSPRPAAGAPQAAQPPAAPPLVAPPARTPLELAELFGPDSGNFNMDTVADMQVPDFLNPSLPSSQPGPSPYAPPRPPGPSDLPANQPSAFAEAQSGPGVSGAHPVAAVPDEGAIDPRQYIWAAVIGVGVAIVLGGVGLAVWRFAAPQGAPTPVGGAPVHSEVRPASSALTTPDPWIRFRVVPAVAELLLDGQALPPPGRAMTRLSRGQTATLTARAPGYADESMQLDDSVRGTIDIVLTPRDPKPAVAVNVP